MESGIGRIACGYSGTLVLFTGDITAMSYRAICWFTHLLRLLWGMGSYPLLDHNEGMYAAIAKDMLKSGDFIIPHLNGVPYIEKPPMLYWLTAAVNGHYSAKMNGRRGWCRRWHHFATAWNDWIASSGAQTGSRNNRHDGGAGYWSPRLPITGDGAHGDVEYG